MVNSHARPASPKRNRRTHHGTARWYKYYAGYSPTFVRDVCYQLGLNARTALLDPWNGAGTTTDVANALGIRATGFDLNPAMVVVAKARLLGTVASPSETPLTDVLLDLAQPSEDASDDPLGQWFTPKSAAFLRALEASMRLALVSASSIRPSPIELATTLSPLAAFFYVALFRTTRDFLSPFRSSNPTWLKTAAESRSRVDPSAAEIATRFRYHVTEMSSHQGELFAHNLHRRVAQPTVAVGVADSKRLPCKAASVDAIVSSPPYCTRIDYAVATASELAILGFNPADFLGFRRAIIGSPVTAKLTIQYQDGWGPTCADFLQRVASHASKASATYYLRQHIEYFDSISRSLGELDRVLRPGGRCILVVQDSYYKDVHNDLPRIFTEMTDARGWRLTARHDYAAPSHMARVNQVVRRYRTDTHATEAALWFVKE
jgi:SAM-dependent methyltransferase